MRERWLIDGWELTDGTYFDVDSRSGLYVTPSYVGSNVQVANRRGEVWRPKVLGPGKFTLSCTLGVPGLRSAFEAKYDDLMRVVMHGERQLLFQRYLASGEIRECYAEVIGDLAPTPIGQQAVRFAIAVNVPGGLWRSPAAVTSDRGVLTNNMTYNLTEFAASTAPLDDLSIKFIGPQDNPKFTVPETGETMLYTGSLAALASVTIDVGKWTVVGAGGHVANPAALTHTGPRFLTVPARKPGAFVPTVKYEGANIGAAARAQVTGKLAFAV